MIVGLYAVGQNGEFGLNGRLPWGSFPEELAAFNDILESNKGYHILVGYKTWSTLPTSVKKRLADLKYSILVYAERKTRELLELSKLPNVTVITKLDYSLKDFLKDSLALVIGGASLLEECLDQGILDGCYISTVVNKDPGRIGFECDTALLPPLWDEIHMPPATVFVVASGENENLSFVQEYHYFGTV